MEKKVAANVTEYKEIDGFRDWKVFFDFIKDKYSDVSLAFLKKDFEMLKETMRELIDNTYPYHSNVFKLKIDEKTSVEYEYSDYFELLVDKYYKTLDLERQPMTPQNKVEITRAKDNYMKESRKLRRLIMADLSMSGIIPQAIKKKIRQLSEDMQGVGL